ncbi:hypothetical protein GQ457_12G017780 [Hibiscus cannabinus]
MPTPSCRWFMLLVEKFRFFSTEEYDEELMFTHCTNCPAEDGVKQVLEMFKEELKLAMSLVGCSSLKDITRSHDNFILRWCEEDDEK